MRKPIVRFLLSFFWLLGVCASHMVGQSLPSVSKEIRELSNRTEQQTSLSDRKESEAFALETVRMISDRTPYLFRLAEGRSWEADVRGRSWASRVLPIVHRLKHGGIPWKQYLSSDSLCMEARLYGKYDSVTGAYRRGVVSFRSDIPQRNKVDDLTALALLGENVYAEEFDFGNRQIFPNPIRREAEAFYTYRLDSLYEKDGITYRRIAFRGLSGLNHGTVTIDATHGQLAILEMRVMMKGVITESYRVELGEVEPDLFLPIGLSVVIDRNRLWASLHNGYSASISYTGEQLDKTVLPVYMPTDSSRYRLPDELPVAPVWAVRSSFGREDSSTYWKNVVVGRDHTLHQHVPWHRALAWGHKYRIGERWRLGNEGLVWALFYYNYADHLWLGQSLTAIYDMAPGIRWEIKPGLYYVTKRRKAVWTLDSKLYYSPPQRGLLQLSAGHRSFDLYSTRERIDQLTDLMMELLNGQGPTTRYDDKFVRLTNSIDLLPKLNVETSVMLAERNPLPHGETWSLFGGSITDILNISNADPDLPRIVPHHRLLEVRAKMTFNPRPYYRYTADGFLIREGEGIRAPLLSLSYRGAFGMGRKSDARFHHLDLSIQQRLVFSPASSLFYQLNVGGYFDRSVIYPSEYFFLKGGNAFWRFGDSMEAAFQTLPPYTATADKHLILQTSYRASRLLVNFLPFVFLKTNDEALHFKARWDMVSRKPYLEMGYSESIGTLMQVGVFYGGYNFFYERGVAIRFTFNM